MGELRWEKLWQFNKNKK